MLSNEMIKIIAITAALVMVVKGNLPERVIKKIGFLNQCIEALVYITFMLLMMAYIHNANQL